MLLFRFFCLPQTTTLRRFFFFCRLNTFICVTASSEKYEEELEWIRAGIEEKGRSMKKVVIYVNSIAMCERLYIWFSSSLNEKAYDGSKTIEHRLVEMYHAHTDADSKERIMSDFCRSDGYIKVLVATVAVGMGIDICDITVIVIWGLPPSLLQLWQEAGRCGRDGRESIAVTYAFPRSIALPCNNCRKQGKSVCTCQNRSYLKQLVSTSDCQRAYILQSFSLNKENEKELHDLKNKKGCSGTCTDICRCSLCTCCRVCLQSCKCPKHNESMKQQILFYLN
ncbi:MAG: helicase-related protein [Candidatus Thiodiazotropha sp.]